MSEWRLVGPGLASLIVVLNLPVSNVVGEDSGVPLDGVRLGIGTLHQTLHEAAAAVAPAEAELIQEIQASDLLYADETSWPQQDQDGLLWLWTFITTRVTYYTIAGRGKPTVLRVLAGFTGWLMTDGCVSYRSDPKRLRC